MDQPLGLTVDERCAISPPRSLFTGRYVLIEPLGTQHIDDLCDSLGQPEHATLWAYVPTGPFQNIHSRDL